jgi:hypothetical protein
MTVIPVSQGVEFEVEIAPDAIDTVHIGQKARIRFPAFDQRSTPELTGAISGSDRPVGAEKPQNKNNFLPRLSRNTGCERFCPVTTRFIGCTSSRANRSS